MRHDNLLNPVSESEPAGPDLDEVGDDLYLNYYLPAAARIPERFYESNKNDTPGVASPALPYDRTRVDLKTELKAIAELLQRTHDLRLLTLEARFLCLAGQIAGFSECVHAMAGLLQTQWDHVHPVGTDGDFTLRQNILGGIVDQTSILLPIQYTPLASDKRIGHVSLREYMVTSKLVTPRAEDRNISMADLLEVMRLDTNRATVASAHAAALVTQAGLKSIRETFIDKAGYEYAPSFDGLDDLLKHLRTFIETAIPELTPADAPPQEDAVAEGDAESPADDGLGASPAKHRVAELIDAAAVSVPDHPSASAALLALENYFVAQEPSSPALILVHQARMLVGKPLVAALETLMPDIAAKAIITLDAAAALQLPMLRMKAITETLGTGSENAKQGKPAQAYGAETRPEAAALISGIERFYRSTEPSSPIPMLLAKARGFMSRDFTAILSDLIKIEPGKPAG